LSSVQQHDLQVHRPEVCYPMSGYPIIENRPVKVRIGNKGIPARYLTADRGALQEMILYWTRVGNSFPLNWAQQRIEMARANVGGVIPDGALLRFSTISEEGSNDYPLLTDFASKLATSLNPKMKDVFFGKNSKQAI